MTLVSVNAHESNTPQAVMNPAFSRVHPYKNILYAYYLNAIYLLIGISLFYFSFSKARKKGSLINMGE